MNGDTVHSLLFNILIPLGIFLVVLFVGYLLRKLLLNRIRAWGKRSKSKFADIFIISVKGPLLIWFTMLAIYLAIKFSTLSQEVIDVTGKILLVLGILSITMVASNITIAVIQLYSKKAKTASQVTSLTRNIARIIIFGIGALIILNSLNVQISPILATLGVGGLAIALALQETLSNLFAGFYITASRQIKVGDYIKLESGEEGYVTDIGWRTTKIRGLPNNVVLVPNDKLAKVIVTDYFLPEKEMAVLINLGVHYNSDLKKVERVTIEVATEVMKEVPGGVPTFTPFMRYNTFADFSINFTVILRAREFVDQYLLKHEFIKRLHERYKVEGIVIPFPIRAINYDQEQAGQERK